MASDTNDKKRMASNAGGVAPAQPAERGGIRELENLFAACSWPDARALPRARKRARERAQEMLESHAAGADANRAALQVAAAELFRGLIAERALSASDAAGLAWRIEELTGLSAVVLARE